MVGVVRRTIHATTTTKMKKNVNNLGMVAVKVLFPLKRWLNVKSNAAANDQIFFKISLVPAVSNKKMNTNYKKNVSF
jgi:hypothetical protein